jgi:hypothetical protein
VFDIVSKLLRAGLGEIHPVISAQPARLSLEIRPVLDIAPGGRARMADSEA